MSSVSVWLLAFCCSAHVVLGARRLKFKAVRHRETLEAGEIGRASGARLTTNASVKQGISSEKAAVRWERKPHEKHHVKNNWPKIKSRPNVQWGVALEDGWESYPASVVSMLDSAWSKGKWSAEVNIASQKHTIDFSRMVQRRHSCKTERIVRRWAPPPLAERVGFLRGPFRHQGGTDCELGGWAGDPAVADSWMVRVEPVGGEEYIHANQAWGGLHITMSSTQWAKDFPGKDPIAQFEKAEKLLRAKFKNNTQNWCPLKGNARVKSSSCSGQKYQRINVESETLKHIASVLTKTGFHYARRDYHHVSISAGKMHRVKAIRDLISSGNHHCGWRLVLLHIKKGSLDKRRVLLLKER